MTDSTVTPGWYPDPQDSSGSRLRWWDGTAWTEQYSPAADSAATTPTTVLPVAAETQKSGSKTPLILGVVAVVALLVIGGGVAAALLIQPDEPSSTSSSPSAADGVPITAEGANLVLPSGWEEVPTTNDDLQAFLDEAAAANPDMANTLQGALSGIGDQGFAMFAIAPDLSTDAFVTNANLIVTPNDGTSLSDAGTSQTAQLEQVGATDVTTTQIDVNGVPALRTEYTIDMNAAGGAVTVQGIQYLVIGDQNAAFLTVSATSDNAAADADSMAQSLVVD